MRRRHLAGACTALLLPAALVAQTSRWSLDVGSSRTKYADSIEATALSITPSFVDPSSRFWLNGSVTLSQLAGAQSNSGFASGSFFTGRQRGLFAEIQAIGGGSNHSDGSHTAQFLGAGRLHFDRTSKGAWIGAGVGEAWDVKWRTLRQADAGFWVASDSASFVASAVPTIVDDTIRYADANLAVHRDFVAWALDGALGLRAGNQLPTLPANHKVWGSFGATYWLTNRVGVIASAGSYPVDFTQGFPGGQYVSLAVRLRSRPNLSLADVQARRTPAEIRSFRVVRAGAGQQSLRVFAPTVQSVDVMGDFTQWTAVALESDAGGWWSVTLPIASGTHEVNVRIDGGPWISPPGLASLQDEFGGVVGLLVIPK